MKFLLTILFATFVAFTPTYSFAQTDETTDAETSTETVEDTTTTEEDTTTTAEDETVEETEITDTTTTDETIGIEESTDTTAEVTTQPTTTGATNTTSEKTITDYLPYILLGGAGILLISIIAIIFSGREPKEKKEKTVKKEDEKLPEAPRFEQKTDIQPQLNVQPNIQETPKAEVTSEAVTTTVQDLVKKPTEQNMVDDLAALNTQASAMQSGTPEVQTTPVVDNPIQEIAPVTQTLDEPISDVEQIQNIAAQLPQTEEVPEMPQAPVTETPVENFNMQTPTLHTQEPVQETPQIDPALAQLSQDPVEIEQAVNEVPTQPAPQTPIMETRPQAIQNDVPPVQEPQPVTPMMDTQPQVIQTVEPTPQVTPPVQNNPVATNPVQEMVQNPPLAEAPVQNMGVQNPQPVEDTVDDMPPAPPIM